MELTREELDELIGLTFNEKIQEKLQTMIDSLKEWPKIGQICRVWDITDKWILCIYAGNEKFFNVNYFLEDVPTVTWENFQPLPFFIDVEASREKGDFVPMEVKND